MSRVLKKKGNKFSNSLQFDLVSILRSAGTYHDDDDDNGRRSKLSSNNNLHFLVLMSLLFAVCLFVCVCRIR